MMPHTRPIRIATVYKDTDYLRVDRDKMSEIRWSRISEALARQGFEVDELRNQGGRPAGKAPNLRWVPLSQARWTDYDVVKTQYQGGFETLQKWGGHDHPFLIGRLASVVGREEGAVGTHFHGEEHARLYSIQKKMAGCCRYISVTTEQNSTLWSQTHGRDDGPGIVSVPSATDRVVPMQGENPFRELDGKIAVYIGNFYVDTLPHINRLWQERLNILGRRLRRRGIHLCVIGPGKTDRLDPRCLTYLGAVPNSRIWDYQSFADVGLVLALGPVQNNDSSKIYYYLRSGLPVVSERPVPNNFLIRDSRLGYIVDYEDPEAMVDSIEAACSRTWDRAAAIDYIVNYHTWDHRAQVYSELIRARLGHTHAADRTVYRQGQDLDISLKVDGS